MNCDIENSFFKLKDFCEKEGFKGYDPYDGLNSTIFKRLPILNKVPFFRLAWIQFFKLFPFNIRRYVGIKKEYNPKAMGLFLSGYCKLYQKTENPEYLIKINFFIEKIMILRSKGYSGDCWGYNFDWESRAFFQPKYMPTIVASAFVANALLDAYDLLHDEKLMLSAKSTCNFFLNDLHRSYDSNGNFSFSYSPLDRTIVFNASFLGASLLSRVYNYTKEDKWLIESKKVISFCCLYQKTDGSWSYGTLPFHQWIDNFHTGYNLECLSDYMKHSGDDGFKSHLNKGLNYYINTFFTKEGVSKYYNNSVYPIDIHAPAQLVITLYKLNMIQDYKALVEKVICWTIINMQSKRGFFYYRINRHFNSKIPYMRWSQAWMFYAFCVYFSVNDGLTSFKSNVRKTINNILSD